MFSKKKKSEEPIMEEKVDDTLANEIQSETPNTNDSSVEESISEIDKLKADNEQLNDKYVRLFAEFDNYKRRTQKERIELLQTAGKDVMVSLLPILDDFDRALKASEGLTEDNPIREGIVLIHNKMKSTLGQKGLKEMQSVNEVFNTDMHEAITKIPAPSEDLKGKVVDELEKGYFLNDKVIRFAKVVVGS
ncbi:MAG: nucleotide exchange factor GrpE [Pedobacter sp.]|nr:MAG: nucleotide exchange factor GrpE [Pedobacter sp.]